MRTSRSSPTPSRCGWILERALQARTETELREALTELNERIARLNSRATDGPPTTLSPVDVEAVVLRWRGF